MTIITSAVVIGASLIDIMNDKELTKTVKLSERAHAQLSRACLASFGTTSIRYSDAIEQFCEQVLVREEDKNDVCRCT